MAACEGAVSGCDATQGVEAQTVSNAILAMNANLDIVPAINKIDLPSARHREVRAEIEDVLTIPADDAVRFQQDWRGTSMKLLEALISI